MGRPTRLITLTAATAVLAIAGLSTASMTSASASEQVAAAACPAKKVCLYDAADYTKLLWTTDQVLVNFVPAKYNDRVSSIINNTESELWIFKHADYAGPLGNVPAGKKWAATTQTANQLSSMYLYA